ncbi:MAG: AEC family transporter [Planctomycetes bacterium]|nr:AEC family transporter [Planctomycetota bacterium]
MLRNVLLNPQTVALMIGFVLALAAPFLVGMEKMGSEELQALPLYIGILSPAWETIYLLGLTTLPISIFQIGLLLGAPRQSIDVGGESPVRVGQLVLLGFLRLIAAPVLCMGILLLLMWFGLPLSLSDFVVSTIVIAMPPAVACLAIVEVYGGRVRLTANAILWQTVAALGTAPLITYVAQVVYRMAAG